MRVFFHTDADGKCAAYWVHKRFPKISREQFTMIDYDMDIDWYSLIEKDEKVIIVDFSFDPDDIRKILNKTKDIIWIDHHKSAIEKYKDFETELPGLRYDGIAGCMLTYCFFFEMNSGKIPFDPYMMPQKAPWMTKYVHDYDVWKYEYGDETEFFKLGLDTVKHTHPFDSIWDNLVNDISNVRNLINAGSICKRYRDSIAKHACDWAAFEHDIDGHKALCLNTPMGGSAWFGDKIENYELVCSYCYIGDGKWSYSLYSNGPKKIDTSKISIKYGGGGHAGASGFTIDRNLFDK